MRKMNKEITLQTYDEIMGVEENLDNRIDKVVEIPLAQLINFKNHPFHVKDNEEMKEMATSIQERGVLCPIIVRPKKSGIYEIVAGHRRKRGCELAGKTVIPCYIRNYTDDEAIIVMVDSNIQRENIVISEKAFAYKLKMAALKHQGVRQGEKETADLVGEQASESGRTVQRYIRLTLLLPSLLNLVDEGKIKVNVGVQLSFLKTGEQRWIEVYLSNNKVSITGNMAATMKEYSEKGTLTEALVQEILTIKKKKTVEVTLSSKKIRNYFPDTYSKQEIEQVITELLDNWKRSRENTA